MRQALVALVLTSLAITSALALPTAAAESDGYEVGPRPWQIGMSWRWENDSAEQKLWVTDETTMKTGHGSYEVFMTRSRRVNPDGTEYLTLTGWTKGSHLRVYDQVHVYRSGADPMTISTSYNPPAPFPIWGSITPGGRPAPACERVHTVTEYSVGFQPAGREEHTYKWCAWADNDVFNITVPSGSFEAFNVTIYREEISEDGSQDDASGSSDSNNKERFRYIYAPKARHYVGTYSAKGDVDFELTELVIDPPPVPHAEAHPSLPQVGENVTLDASLSYDRNGEITTYEWTLPDETVLEGRTVQTVFDEPGRKAIRLKLTDDHDHTTTVTVTVRVIDRAPKFKIAGPAATTVEEATPLRLVVPEDREVRQATWRARDVAPQEGTNATFSFPEPGRYNVSVTFVDSKGHTGALHHLVHVVATSGQTAGNGTIDAERGDLGSLAPGIVSPKNNTRVAEKQVLVVARVMGLEDPALLLPNGLRVPLDAHGQIASAKVPLSSDTSELALVDGHTTIDRVVVHRSDDGSVSSSAERSSGTNDTPFPLAPFLLVIPFLRRRER